MEKIFSVLNKVNVNDRVEKKNGLTYLSWSWAWEVIKSHYPTATYKVYKNADNLNYHHDGKTAWVEVGVTINRLEYIEMLPVMNHRNQSITLENLTSFDVNKAIKRCLAKAIAMHGLGLYIYAGEDLPSEEKEEIKKKEAQTIRDIINELDPVDHFGLISALDDVDKATSKDELLEIWNANKELQGDVTFTQCMTTKKKSLK